MKNIVCPNVLEADYGNLEIKPKNSQILYNLKLQENRAKFPDLTVSSNK